MPFILIPNDHTKSVEPLKVTRCFGIRYPKHRDQGLLGQSAMNQQVLKDGSPKTLEAATQFREPYITPWTGPSYEHLGQFGGLIRCCWIGQDSQGVAPTAKSRIR